VVEVTAKVKIRHTDVDPATGVPVTSDYTAVTTLLARAFFLRPRLSFVKKSGTAFVPIDDAAIVPTPAIDVAGKVLPADPKRQIYLEYRTDDPDPNNTTLTLAARL